MIKIVNCCCENLNQKSLLNSNEPLGEDITNEILIGTSPTILLSAINTNRKIIKIYTQQYSDELTQLWVLHGTNININNFAFALPVNSLYVDTSQASQPLSVMSSIGFATIKLTVVNANKL